MPKVLLQSFLCQMYFDSGKFTNIFIINREHSVTAEGKTLKLFKSCFNNGPEFNFFIHCKSPTDQFLTNWFSTHSILVFYYRFTAVPNMGVRATFPGGRGCGEPITQNISLKLSKYLDVKRNLDHILLGAQKNPICPHHFFLER